MQIQVNTDHNIDGSEEFIAYVELEIRTVLARFASHLTRIEAHLGDESAGRSSGNDKRCLLEARPAGRTPVVVTQHAATAEEATRGAVYKLSRLLDSEFGRAEGGTTRDSIRGKTSR